MNKSKKRIFIAKIKIIIKSPNIVDHLKLLYTYPIWNLEINLNLTEIWINVYKKTKKTDYLRNLENFINTAFQKKYMTITNKQFHKIIALMKIKQAPLNLQNKFKLWIIKSCRYELLKKQQFRNGRKSFSNFELLTGLEKLHLSKKKYPTSNNVRFEMDIKFSDITPIEFAQELTRMCSKYIANIYIHELLSCAWNDSFVEEDAPYIFRLIKIFEKVSYWIGTEILKSITINDMINTMNTFIEIAKELYKLNNFHLLFAINAGLNLASITRLKFLFESENVKKYTEKLNTITDNRINYKKYRQLLAKNLIKSSDPVIPYIGIITRDIIFTLQGNPIYVNNKVNDELIDILYNQLSNFTIYQNNRHCIKRNILPNIIIKNTRVIHNPDILYHLSTTFQPMRRHSVCYSGISNTNDQKKYSQHKLLRKNNGFITKTSKNNSRYTTIRTKNYQLLTRDVHPKKINTSISKISEVSRWTVYDVRKWIEFIELSTHVDKFIRHQITGEELFDFSKLNDSDLGDILKNELNISLLGHRMKFIRELKILIDKKP